MSRKNLTAQDLSLLFSKDKRTSISFKNFLSEINNIKKKFFLVGVSGGPDSLALAALCKAIEKDKNSKIFFLHVNHGLRKNASKEVIIIKNLLKKIKSKLYCIKVKKKIFKNIQSEARKERYKIFQNFSLKKNLPYVLTAHHKDDQIETFLIRLSRGSGVQGLSSMSRLSKLSYKSKILRPLLNFEKRELKYIAKKVFGKYLKDPSNKNNKFLRVKIRGITPILEKSGIPKDQIIKSIKNLSSSNSLINNYINLIYNSITEKKKNKIFINFKKIKKETEEVKIKILNKAIINVSKSYYPPRSKKVKNLIENLSKNNVCKLTLANCLISKSGDIVKLEKEIKNI